MIEIYPHKNIMWDGIEFYIADKRGGTLSIATNIEFEEVDRTVAENRPPVMVLRNEQAQALMDRLWECGLRPSEGTGSAGALAATQKHLEDMRKIAFKYVEDAQAP